MLVCGYYLLCFFLSILCQMIDVEFVPLLQGMKRMVRLVTCLHSANSHLNNLKMPHLVSRWKTLSPNTGKRLQMLYIKGNWIIKRGLLLSALTDRLGLIPDNSWYKRCFICCTLLSLSLSLKHAYKTEHQHLLHGISYDLAVFWIPCGICLV